MSDFRNKIAEVFPELRRECPDRVSAGAEVHDLPMVHCVTCWCRGYVPAPDPEMGWALLEMLVPRMHGHLLLLGAYGDYQIENDDEETVGSGATKLEALASAALALKEGL